MRILTALSFCAFFLKSSLLLGDDLKSGPTPVWMNGERYSLSKLDKKEDGRDFSQVELGFENMAALSEKSFIGFGATYRKSTYERQSFACFADYDICVPSKLSNSYDDFELAYRFMSGGKIGGKASRLSYLLGSGVTLQYMQAKLATYEQLEEKEKPYRSSSLRVPLSLGLVGDWDTFEVMGLTEAKQGLYQSQLYSQDNGLGIKDDRSQGIFGESGAQFDFRTEIGVAYKLNDRGRLGLSYVMESLYKADSNGHSRAASWLYPKSFSGFLISYSTNADYVESLQKSMIYKTEMPMPRNLIDPFETRKPMPESLRKAKETQRPSPPGLSESGASREPWTSPEP